MRKGSLWSIVVFKKEVIFHKFDFETCCWNQASESTQLGVTMEVTRVFFLPLLSRNFDANWVQIFLGLLFCALLRYTKWEEWSLTITNIKNWTVLIFHKHSKIDLICMMGRAYICFLHSSRPTEQNSQNTKNYIWTNRLKRHWPLLVTVKD